MNCSRFVNNLDDEELEPSCFSDFHHREEGDEIQNQHSDNEDQLESIHHDRDLDSPIRNRKPSHASSSYAASNQNIKNNNNYHNNTQSDSSDCSSLFDSSSDAELSDEEAAEDGDGNNDDSINDDNLSSSNIYDYDGVEDTDTLYFDKYEYDVNSMCCQLNSALNSEYNLATHEYVHTNVNQVASGGNNLRQPTLTNMQTAAKAAATTTTTTTTTAATSSTIYKPPSFNCAASSTHTNANAPISKKSTFIQAQMNTQRLLLIDLLLQHGADKYLVTKLSLASIKRMDRRSRNSLLKWYSNSSNSSGSAALASSSSNQTWVFI